MNIQRSPPNKGTGSHPNLTLLRDDEFTTHVSLRKRKTPDPEQHVLNELKREISSTLVCFREELQKSLLEFRQEFKSTIEGMLNKQNEHIQLLREDLNNVYCDINKMKESQNTLITECTELTASIISLKEENNSINTKVSTLENKLDVTSKLLSDFTSQLQIKEQEGRKNNLEITGVPLAKTENLHYILNQIAVKVGFTLTTHDVDYIHRVRRFVPRDSGGEAATAIPNIIVRFAQRSRKNELLAAVRARRGVATSDIGMDGPSRQIFVSDHLAPHNKLLYRRVRDLGKELGYKYIWIKDCKIFVRRSDTSKALLIATEADLDKIK